MKTILLSLRRYTLTIFLTAFLLFCFAIPGFATTYYIDPSGNDITGTGTIGNPWKTLNKATSAPIIASGDTIHVNAGTYIETVKCILPVGVSIEGDGISSVIKSTYVANFEPILLAQSAEGTNGNQHISNLKFDGQNLLNYSAIWVSGRSNVSIYNCTVVDFQERGIIFSARNDLSDGPPAIYSTGNSFHDNYVNNCAAYNTPNGIYGRGCLSIGGQNGMLIYNDTITQNSRPEGFNGWPIKYCNDGYLNGVKIYKNILTKIPYGGNFPGETGWDFAIELFHIQGLEIDSNTIQGSIDLNYNTKGPYPYCAWIHHNLMSRATLNTKYESGIIFEFDTETAIVENNILNNLSSGVSFNTRSGTVISNCVIGKNSFTNLGYGDGAGTAGGILVISEGTNDPVITNLYIYNNTITAAPGKEPFIGIYFASEENGSANAVYIRNNTVSGFGEAWLIGSSVTHMSNVAVLHNHATGNGNNNLPLWPGGDPVDYTFDYKLNDPNAQNGIYFHTDH